MNIHSNRDEGFTLVEVLMAMIVLGIGVAALMSAMGVHIKTTVVNKSQSQGTALLAAAAEYVKALPWQSSCAPTSVQTVGIADVPHDPNFTLTYGPATAGPATFGKADPSCSTLEAVPVNVDSTLYGFHLSVTVLKRPPSVP